MSTIIIKNKLVAPLPYLNLLVLRYIYEPDTMTLTERTVMEESVVAWSKKTELKDMELLHLNYIVSLLEKNEKGKFNQRKENFKRHGISWRLFHGLKDKDARPN